MILLYGHGGDPSIASVLAVLQAMAVPFVMLDVGDLEQARLQMAVGLQGLSAALVWPQHRLALDAVTAVYARPWGLVQAEAGEATQNPQAQLVQQQLLDWLDVGPGLVLNRPMAIRANAHGLAQAQQVGAAGFLLPPALVSSDEDEIRTFIQSHGRVLFTDSSGVRCTATAQDGSWLSRLHSQPVLPIHFQAFVVGHALRLLVVGRQVFAVEPAVVGAGSALPEDLVARCVALVVALGLAVAGIDLCLRPDGAHVCLAVDPVPALVACGRHVVTAVAQALAVG